MLEDKANRGREGGIRWEKEREKERREEETGGSERSEETRADRGEVRGKG